MDKKSKATVENDIVLGTLFIAVAIFIALVYAYSTTGIGVPQRIGSTTAPAINYQTTTISPQNLCNITLTGAMLNSTYAVKVAYSPALGSDYLVNNTGRALYVYAPDIPYSNSSSCYGGCSIQWPPFYPANLSALPPSVNGLNFGYIKRTNGALQLTYDGRPLYYRGNEPAYDISGEGQNGTWYVVDIPSASIPH